MRWITSTRYQELRKAEYELEAQKLQYEQLDNRYDRLDAEHDKNIEKIQDQHQAELRKIQRQHAEEAEQLQVLKQLNNSSVKVKQKEVSLESREALLKAKTEEFENLSKELAKASEKAEKARAEGEKKGYADGVSDGLREATKITSEDRKMMGQVAALAAASHQSDATSKIAEAIAKDLHGLPEHASKKQ